MEEESCKKLKNIFNNWLRWNPTLILKNISLSTLEYKLVMLWTHYQDSLCYSRADMWCSWFNHFPVDNSIISHLPSILNNLLNWSKVDRLGSFLIVHQRLLGGKFLCTFCISQLRDSVVMTTVSQRVRWREELMEDKTETSVTRWPALLSVSKGMFLIYYLRFTFQSNIEL